MRSRASGAARLEASSCCFSERALALSEPKLFFISFSCFVVSIFQDSVGGRSRCGGRVKH